jgi:hypothetical protein
VKEELHDGDRVSMRLLFWLFGLFVCNNGSDVHLTPVVVLNHAKLSTYVALVLRLRSIRTGCSGIEQRRTGDECV